jgi:RHS repeat-associated protein
MPGRAENSGQYRYGFQGQEKDDETKGQGNSINYKYRMHDPRVGRFFSVDPLSGKYPWNSPYTFSENRVLDGVELEGSEFLDFRDARIIVIRGDLHLRLENFGDTYQHIFNTMQRNAGADHYYYGKVPISNKANSIGWSTKISDFITLDTRVPPGLLDDSHLNNMKGLQIGGTKNKANGDPDMRTKANRINASGGVRTSGKGAGLLTAFMVAVDMYSLYQSTKDGFNNLEDRQTFDSDIEIFKKFQETMVVALNTEGLIPDEYRTVEGLTQISNMVLTGENPTGDENVQAIGMFIIKNIAKNYRGAKYTMDVKYKKDD